MGNIPGLYQNMASCKWETQDFQAEVKPTLV